MELGALICLPTPRCSHCPLRYTCRTNREDRIEEFPPRSVSGPLPVRRESLLLLLPTSVLPKLRRLPEAVAEPAILGELLRSRSLPLLLVRRSERGLLGGLWELPNFPQRGKELSGTVAPLSIEIVLDTEREVRHRYSHFEIRFRLVVAVFAHERRLSPWTEQRWVLPTELDSYPRPKVHIEAMRRFGLITD